MRLLPRLFALPVLLAPLVASAVPRHMDIKVTAKKDKRGGVCGATITCAVISDNGMHNRAVVGLVPSAQVGRVTRDSATKTRAKVSVPTTTYQAKKVTIDIDYSTGEFKPGDKFHIVSGWPRAGYTHVFGAVTTTSRDNEITLPGTQTPAMKAAKTQAVAAAKAKVTALKTTQKVAKDALKGKQKTQLEALKARQLAARTRAKDAAAKKTATLQARIAAAKGTPKAATLRGDLAAHRRNVTSAAQSLKWTQERAVRTLQSTHSNQTWTLDNKHSNALAKLQQQSS